MLEGVKFAWPINFQGNFVPVSTYKNHPSARRRPETLRQYVRKELQHDAILGPFKVNPFNSFCVISPLLCVPKRDSDEIRMVHDLSFPESKSVNSGIPSDTYLQDEYQLRLPGISRLVEFIIQKGEGCKIFKRDLKRAFRQIPVDPNDIPLLGFQVDSEFYFHSVLPFGRRSCVMCCQRTTKTVVFILEQEDILVDVYIDDFFGAEEANKADYAFERIKEIFLQLGLLAAQDKDVAPAYVMLCLGILVNSLDMTLSVPDFRIAELHAELNRWSTLEKVAKREVQSMLRKLSYVAACITPGRAFMSSLISFLSHFKDRKERLPVSDRIREDISWWKLFLRDCNGVSIMPGQSIMDSPDEFSCDASTSGGCGAVCMGEYFHATFPDLIKEHDPPIGHLELLTIVVSIKLWKEKLKGKIITLYSDSETAVKAVANKRSSVPFMQASLRELFIVLALHNITLIVKHVPGKKNILADYLSRWHLKAHY